MNTTATATPRPRPSLIRALAVLCGVLAAVAVIAAPASAKMKVTGKFDVSGVGTNNEITKGPDGNVWVTLDQTNDIARITPKGKVKEFNPVNVDNPVGIASGPGKTLWVTQANGIAVFDPNDPDSAEDFTINDIADARAIVKGPDGNMWTVSGQNVIRIPADDPESAESFPVLVAGRDIDRGKDGRLWVADFGSQVVRVKTDGTAKAYDTGSGSGLQAIAAGPKGEAGYADPTSNPQIAGRVVDGKVKRFKTAGDPFGVAYRAKTYWMPRFATGDLLGLSAAKGKAAAPVGFGQSSGPRRIAKGPDKTLWVTLDTADKVARVSGVKPVKPPR
jgi:virginiamycin B lyase